MNHEHSIAKMVLIVHLYSILICTMYYVPGSTKAHHIATFIYTNTNTT